VLRAVHRLKQALRARFARGPVEAETAERLAAAIGAATEAVETSMPDPAPGTTASLAGTAAVKTPKAADYAAQFCEHVAHKLPARFDGGDGEIGFAAGTCRLHAAATC
jgi:hypothetical protein